MLNCFLFLASLCPVGAQSQLTPSLVSKEVFLHKKDGKPPVTGFVTYIEAQKPVLMHCHGWTQFSDGYDDYSVSISEDNGKIWSKEEVRWKSEVVPEGRIRYAEPAAYFDKDTGKLLVITDRALYPKDKLNIDAEYTLVLDIFDARKRSWAKRKEISFPGQRSPAVSFSFPIKTRSGRLLFPAMRKVVDADGKPVHYRSSSHTVDELVTLIGEYLKNGEIKWHLGKPLQISPDESSRGLDENTLAELPDGRIAAICRGDNSAYRDRPGYKWLTFSSDGGESWSPPQPLPATGGPPIESGANGSALFRSLKNGKLYWMGSLALDGEHANANWPRSPLVIVEVQEQPFELKRDTIFVVDRRGPTDSPKVQLSNFRFYQDREAGDVVVFLTRYGERSEKEWMDADYYRYRVRMPDAQQPAKKLPLPGELFTVEGHQAFVIAPQKQNKGPIPWVWYAPTLPPYPGPEEKWMFERFLEAGIAVAGIDVGESYGSPEGQKFYSALYDELTKRRSFSKKPFMLGRSRGGLMTLAWAENHPDKIEGFAGIYPVCDIASYPGIEKAAGAYGLSPEELKARLTEFNPVDRLNSLAKARVPLFAIQGDVDKVVPLEANSGLMKSRYDALGGKMELILAPGQGHNMWYGFFQCKELVDFVIRCARPRR